MARLYVEDWSPEYGAPFESDPDTLPSEVVVDTAVEVRGAWEPLPGRDDGVRRVAFVDGVQRLEARLTLDDPDTGPQPGICAAYAVGATLWDREAGRSSFVDVAVHRLAIFGDAMLPDFPAVPGLDYRVEATEARDIPSFTAVLGGRRNHAETALAGRLADPDCFVIKDGRIDDVGPLHAVGYIKSHSRTYLSAPESRVIGMLKAGERTPIFAMAEHFRRYSWYVRLADMPYGHSWSGIARVEAPEAIGIDRARLLADRTAALLPMAAMPLHLDSRAPQNLVPIAALEKELRRWLGDEGLVRRALRSAVHGAPTGVAS
ncbi:MAG: hypothetical protein O2822_05145 [Chloroflexi bacterium]|nr:hypothetical protein [Chloroflexota bacterium]